MFSIFIKTGEFVEQCRVISHFCGSRCCCYHCLVFFLPSLHEPKQMLVLIQEENVVTKDTNFIVVTISLWFIKKGRLLERKNGKNWNGDMVFARVKIRMTFF